MKAYYSDLFTFPLPDGHRFPIRKYEMLRERVRRDRDRLSVTLHVPEAASDRELACVHTPAYLQRVTTGGLTEREIRAIGFPWSPELVERSRRSVGGTIAASRAALEVGGGANLAGGTHHAFSDRGQGFCVFNDVAVAARRMQLEGRVERVLIVDCDVHQGNGTADIFQGDESVFTFSIHGARNFPFRKSHSDLDIALPDGTGDEAYLEALAPGLDHGLARAQAGMAIYLAGADPHRGDRLGRLSLSMAGLAARDELVYSRCREWGLPVATVMSGGYGRRIEDTVAIHFTTLRIAARALHLQAGRRSKENPSGRD